ncbi:Mannosyltransferase 1 CMT1 [Penicillium odoratum]|uniref:Mannosyltransferase 1 CMT1 n=1 Tax=Penicillium odoratum TaxID=1167516 RepID=UPI0025467BCB|nr:Mannosyltransferase 1 CMT1 [Penicillium odoratum]KAJ5777027.1 Mannosyltransferase 1 CMT1 [Penicillium odoratum]
MGNFTIVNGQLYTPGLAIVDAPQPSTPLGGGKSTFNLPKLPLTEPANLQVAIDVSGNGALPWPPSTQSANSPTLFHNITLFLTSESKSQNFTISNGTVPATNTTGFVGPVLDLEPSSTVKHVNWIWPECLVGTNDGIYNISMHQSFRWNVRSRILRLFLLIFFVWNIIELHLILRRVSEVDVHRDQPRRRERIYIASVNWNNEIILRNHWSQALLELALKLGPENIFISIYESGSYDNTKGALMELDLELERLGVPRSITLSHITHEDEMAGTPGEGWIRSPRGEMELRRIPYLSRTRNMSLQPLEELAKQGITFDKILFLNDVVFTPNDVFELLDTNDGSYAAACSMDFAKPPNYYDTFALRDASGHEAMMTTWPFFRNAASRNAMKNLSPVPVQSCWNGMVAMPAAPFTANPPLRFRGIPDSLASSHLEGSECCLIHADNPLSIPDGVFMNPLVRVGYSGPAYVAVNPIGEWLSTWRIFQGLWVNRLRRWTTTTWLKDKVVRHRIDRWASLGHENREPGEFCIINEMQVLHPQGWGHL